MDTPNDMYGKVMSVVDEVIFEYFELVTRVPMAEIAEMQQAVKAGENPMQFKKRLASEIVEFYHGADAAKAAADHFEKTVQNKEISDSDTVEVNLAGSATLLDFLKQAASTNSSADIKRTIEQGGVEVNGQKVTNTQETLDFKVGDVVKFGKRQFFKVN